MGGLVEAGHLRPKQCSRELLHPTRGKKSGGISIFRDLRLWKLIRFFRAGFLSILLR
jgi:hypothetical protein